MRIDSFGWEPEEKKKFSEGDRGEVEVNEKSGAPKYNNQTSYLSSKKKFMRGHKDG